MDLWVAAAVAGAGCLAKYLNKISKNGDNSSRLFLEDSNFENAESPTPTYPFCTEAGGDRLDRRASDVNSQERPLTIELASKEGLESEKVKPFRNFNESDALSVSNLNDIGYGDQQRSNVGGNCGFPLRDFSAGKLGQDHSGNKTSLRTKHLYGHVSRPSNSLESCLMAQLFKAHGKMEESISSSHMATRSSFVSDRNQITSWENDDDSFSGLTGSGEYRLHGEASKVKDKSVLFGVPCVPKIGSSNDARKMKFNVGSGRTKRLRPTGNAFSGKHIHTQHDATFLLSLGISFGIITSIYTNKREMDKLRELLKQTENFVQDLQEELEMKDSMRVKELHHENYGSQVTCDHSYDKDLNVSSPEKHTDSSPITDCKKSYDQKEGESSESMSKIEAELEAELERLGLNINESSSERPLSELAEVDPDFVADFAHGELQTDMISRKNFTPSEPNEDESDTVVPVNYAVSPHELTLLLHEVIQTRLEGRVQELEIALENSQRKLRFMESEHESHSQKCFSSCGRASPNLLTNNDFEPTISDIDTSYEEIIKIDDFEENSPSSIQISDYNVDLHSHDLHALGVQLCGPNDLLTHSTVNEERLSMLEGLSSSNYELEDATGDENCECDYEVERELIRQIVERAKKGSPVVQNARRILYAMDED